MYKKLDARVIVLTQAQSDQLANLHMAGRAYLLSPESSLQTHPINDYGIPDGTGAIHTAALIFHYTGYRKLWNRLWIAFDDHATIAGINSTGGMCYPVNCNDH